MHKKICLLLILLFMTSLFMVGCENENATESENSFIAADSENLPANHFGSTSLPEKKTDTDALQISSSDTVVSPKAATKENDNKPILADPNNKDSSTKKIIAKQEKKAEAIQEKNDTGKTKSDIQNSQKTKKASAQNKKNKDQPVPTSQKEIAQSITIEGSGVPKTVMFSLADIRKMELETYTYFSRGKDPKEALNTYTGITLSNILQKAGLKSDAKKVKIVAEDGYSASFSLAAINEMRIDETDLSKKLPMIIAIAEEGNTLAEGSGTFKLIMGQEFAGDYNRQYWIKRVSKIIVQ